MESTFPVDAILNSTKKLFKGSSSAPFGLHEPWFEDTQAWANVKDCLDTGWVSSGGKWVNDFEKKICEYTGAKYAIAVTNGTVALRLALHLVGVRDNDEVIIPPLSFVATANAIKHLGAHPHFVDIESNSLGMCPDLLSHWLDNVAEKTSKGVFNKSTQRRISAVLPVHVFGHPARIERLNAICSEWGLPVVEDAAEALGSFVGKTHCGRFGKVGIFSFNGNKIITAGGGGALITDDPDLALRAKHLSTTAKIPHPWNFFHDEIAWNDRMPNLNAALVVAQLADINRRISLKQSLHAIYTKAFSHINEIKVLQPSSHVHWNYWLITMYIHLDDDDQVIQVRDQLLRSLHDQKFMSRPVWQPLHTLPMFTDCPKSCLEICNHYALRLINLPSSPQLVQQIS